MDDLISRQAAIDAVNTWDKFGVDERGRLVGWHEGLEPYVHLRDVLNAIVFLPSAQQWVPCEKDVPILPNIVLACDSSGKIIFDSYIDGSWTYCPCVVAWMPLPKPFEL